MKYPDDDSETLFPLPAPQPPPGRASLPPRDLGFIPKTGRALIEAMKERWKEFFEWSGFTKREIEVEIIPGRKCKVAIPQEAPPKVIIFRLFKDKKTGTFFTRPVDLWGGLIRFNSTLCEDLALPIGRTTLWRLIYGGFVDAFRPAPMVTLIDLESLRLHLIATKIDGEKSPYWTRERITKYREWEKITPETLARLEAEGEDQEDGE